MNKIFITISILLLSLTSLKAGFKSKLPLKWGKVSPAEFSVKSLGKDSLAPAIVLCDFGDMEITNRTFYIRHTRIKILNEAGLNYATVEIPYQTKNRQDVFYNLKAQTHVYENGKIITYKVDPGNIEDIQIDNRWSKKKFTFPMVKPGAIIEYRYEIASLDFEKLDTWYFQREIPTIWSEIRFKVPTPFTYLVSFENNRDLGPDEEGVFGDKLQWMYDTKPKKRSMELIRNNYLLFNTNENRYKVWAMNNTRKKIVMRNLPGFNPSMDNQTIAEHYPQVRFDLFESSGNLPYIFRPLILTTHEDYEERGEWAMMHSNREYFGYIHYRLKTWSQYNDRLLENEHFGGYLIKSAGTALKVPDISDNSMNEVDKIQKIFHNVRKNFQWNGKFSMVAGQDFNDLLKSRSGSSAEMNLLLVNMFRHYGIESDPVIIRTSDLGKPEKMYPVKDQFNHVIASAKIGGSVYLFDATVDSPELNNLNKLAVDTEGWIVNRENPGWIQIYSKQTKQVNKEIPQFNL